MLGLEMDFAFNESTISSNHAAFLDPSIGQYCLLLTTKNSMRNATGERHTSILGRWAILMTATALNRSGFPVSSFECMLLLYLSRLRICSFPPFLFLLLFCSFPPLFESSF